jgi:hypothetical protein
MPATGAFAEDVVARLRDFFDPTAHWQRRLWNVGLLLQLRETLEASEAVRARALSQESLASLAERVRRHVALDPGAGDQPQRTAVLECLKRDLAADGVNYLTLKQLVAELDGTYLPRWAAELRVGGQLPGRERTARALAAHLLDSGLGLLNLTRWLDGVSAANAQLDVSDLFDDAARLLQLPRTRYEVLVPFAVEPSRRATRPTEWITSGQAATWLRANGFADIGLRQRGGLLLTLEARDEEGAISMVADTVDQFRARVVVGTSSTFEVYPEIYLAGGGVAAQTRPRRHVKVHALTRADRVYDLTQVGPIDSALELLAHLDTAAPPVAVAAGWSAIESLLVGAGDKANVVAADRLAALVACSWPRAELTDIAWAKARQRDEPLCDELLRLSTNRAKARRITDELRPGARLAVNRASDVAAARRISKLLADARPVLIDVRAHATECFRRLYRVRNIILHGGEVRPVALDATLRTAPPLVGAGMDRVTHAYLVTNRLPLEIAARAELEIARAGSAGAPALTDLLE